MIVRDFESSRPLLEPAHGRSASCRESWIGLVERYTCLDEPSELPRVHVVYIQRPRRVDSSNSQKILSFVFYRPLLSLKVSFSLLVF